MSKNRQQGFSAVEAIIILLVISVVGFVGYKVANGGKDKPEPVAQSQQRPKAEEDRGEFKWEYNHQTRQWETKGGKAPKCKEPFKFDNTPVDLSKITLVGMPGVYRGYNYKPHGGFRADTSPDGRIEVRMPMDATLVGLVRYYEGNPAELQYLLTFESDCGIAFRFDHLQTLTPEFDAIAKTTPEPKLNESRSDPNIKFQRTKFKAGDLVATGVGFPQVKNFGFDFGVYDYRKRNEISKNTDWVAIHNNYTSLEWHGVCWFDMLPGDDAAKAKELSKVILNPAKPNLNKVSDYCSEATYKTLDFNGGQPTDG